MVEFGSSPSHDVSVPRGDYLTFVTKEYEPHTFTTEEREFLEHLGHTSPDSVYERLRQPGGQTREILKKAGREDLYDSLAWAFAFRSDELVTIMGHLAEKMLRADENGESAKAYYRDLQSLKLLSRAMMFDLGISHASETPKVLEEQQERSAEELERLLNKDPREYYRGCFRKEMLDLPRVWSNVRLVQKPILREGKNHSGTFLEFSFTHSEWRTVPTENLSVKEQDVAEGANTVLRLLFQDTSNTFVDKKYYVSKSVNPEEYARMQTWLKEGGLSVKHLTDGVSRKEILDAAAQKILDTTGVGATNMPEIHQNVINQMFGIARGFNRDTVMIKGDHGWSGRARVMDSGVAQAYDEIWRSLQPNELAFADNARVSRNNIFIVTSDNMGILPHDEKRTDKNPYLSEAGYRDFRNLKSFGVPRFSPVQYGETIIEQDLNLVFGMLGEDESGKVSKILEICWSFGGMAGIEGSAGLLVKVGQIARQRMGRDLVRLQEYLDDLPDAETLADQDANIRSTTEHYRKRIQDRINLLATLMQQVVPSRKELPLQGVVPDYRTLAITPAHEDTSTFLGKLRVDASTKEIQDQLKYGLLPAATTLGDHAKEVLHAKSSAAVLKTGEILHKTRITKLPPAGAGLGAIASLFTGWRLLPPKNSIIREIGQHHALNFSRQWNNEAIALQVEGLLGYRGLSENKRDALASDQLPMIAVYAADDRLLGYGAMMSSRDRMNDGREAAPLSLIFNNGTGHSVMASNEFRDKFPYDLFAMTQLSDWFAIQDVWRGIAHENLGPVNGRSITRQTPEQVRARLEPHPEFGVPKLLVELEHFDRVPLQRHLLQLERRFAKTPIGERVIRATNQLAAHIA